ncbi:MAG: aminopeptidase [Acidobacteriota bacterium]|nr:aminopeptidase [Acidobacteriota bacterium]
MDSGISKKDLETWADYLLDHSLGGIRPEDVVMLKGEPITWPLLSILQDKVFAAGAVADLNLVAPDNDRGKVWGASIARHGTIAQIERVPAWHRQRYEAMTKYLEVLGAECPDLFTGLPEETAQAVMRVDEPIKEIRLLKPWVITLYPTQAFADLEEMSLEEYTRVIVSASTTDPLQLERIEAPLHELMSRTRTIRVVTAHPDGRELTLRLSIAGRNVIKCTGKRNFPDGEVFTSPDARSVEGEIFVDMPVFYGGTTIRGVYLRFVDGVIQEYSALEGGDALAKIIETDDGSHRLGEIALGMNAGIEKVLRHPLFVEKVGGTLHIAIGASYPECFVDDPASGEGRRRCDELYREGLLNRSAQHVDIVTDFRPGGAGRAVYFDDTRLEVRDRIWVAP